MPSPAPPQDSQAPPFETRALRSLRSVTKGSRRPGEPSSPGPGIGGTPSNSRQPRAEPITLSFSASQPEIEQACARLLQQIKPAKKRPLSSGGIDRNAEPRPKKLNNRTTSPKPVMGDIAQGISARLPGSSDPPSASVGHHADVKHGAGEIQDNINVYCNPTYRNNRMRVDTDEEEDYDQEIVAYNSDGDGDYVSDREGDNARDTIRFGHFENDGGNVGEAEQEQTLDEVSAL